SVVQGHETACTAAVARAADRRAHVVARDTAGHCEAARATAAAETLREYAVRSVAACHYRCAAIEQYVATEAAAIAGAAERERRGRTVGDAAGYCETTVTPAAANTLRNDAVGVCALRLDHLRGAQHSDVLCVAAAFTAA